jgi:acetyltransferase
MRIPQSTVPVFHDDKGATNLTDTPFATVREAVFDTLRRVAGQVSVTNLNWTTPLRDQLDLDSMDWLNVLVALREALGVDIPESDYAKLVTLNDLFAYLDQHRLHARYPHQLVRTCHLVDGRTVTIRPIRPDDIDHVRDFLMASSEEGRYKRFLKWVHTPSNNLAHFLTDIDYDRCLALVCVVARGADAEIVGEARYVANPDGKSCEFGVMIEDAWHKTGIAGLLMEVLIEGARDRGYTAMEGLMLATNTAMLRFAHALGFEVEPIAGDRTTLHIFRRLQPASASTSVAGRD